MPMRRGRTGRIRISTIWAAFPSRRGAGAAARPPHGEAVLFCRERDPERERWHGPSIGTERAVADYGMDDAFPIDDIDDILPGMIEGRGRVYCHFGREPEFDAQLLGWMRRLRQLRGGGVVPKEFVALGHLLHDLRLYKSRAELKLMRASAAIAVEAHLAAMQLPCPGVRIRSRSGTAARDAQPRRGAGVSTDRRRRRNACVMHYQANRAPLRDGELAADRCRCRAGLLCVRHQPHVSGQRSLQPRAARAVRSGAGRAAGSDRRSAPGRRSMHRTRCAVRVITEGLCALGLLKGDADDAAIAEGSYKRFFPPRPATGWAWTCTTSATIASTANRACWSRAWC
jgi:Xaa-Pro aminopeptidase